MTSRAVVYVCYGEPARREAALSIASLRWRHDWSVMVIGEPVEGAANVELPRVDAGGRWSKLCALDVAPSDMVLFVDADTRIRSDLSAGFDILEAGWDMAICPSTMQGDDLLWHVDATERAATLDELGYEPLQLQGGLWFVKRNRRTERLFSAWKCEWMRWKGEDQAAFLRALAVAPVKLFLLGYPFNSAGGSIVEHRHGFIRRQQ